MAAAAAAAEVQADQRLGVEAVAAAVRADQRLQVAAAAAVDVQVAVLILEAPVDLEVPVDETTQFPTRYSLSPCVLYPIPHCHCPPSIPIHTYCCMYACMYIVVYVLYFVLNIICE